MEECFFVSDAISEENSNAEFLKKAIQRAFENVKQPYVVMTATTLEEFVKKANTIKEPDEAYVEKDKSMRQTLFELGV